MAMMQHLFSGVQDFYDIERRIHWGPEVRVYELNGDFHN